MVLKTNKGSTHSCPNPWHAQSPREPLSSGKPLWALIGVPKGVAEIGIVQKWATRGENKMSRLRVKTTAILLIVIFMISMFAVAIPVSLSLIHI